MTGKQKDGGSVGADPDDAPELTEAHFGRADWFQGENLVRRGRPKLAAPKKVVTIRLDQDVLLRLRAMGPGWQTRVNARLRQMVEELPERQDAPAHEH